MTDPKPPVIVDTGSELLLFRSVEAAERYLEPIDVENGEYPAAYDSQGQLLELGIVRSPTSHLFGLVQGTSEHVRIRPVAGPREHAQELAARLRAYLGTLGAPAREDQGSLDTLLQQLREQAGFTS